VLGSDFPLNKVLSRSAFNAAIVAAVIALAGGFFALARFQTVESLLSAVPFVVTAAIPAAFFMRRSNYYAKRIYWHYTKLEKKGRYHGHRKTELAAKILRLTVYGFGISGAV